MNGKGNRAVFILSRKKFLLTILLINYVYGVKCQTSIKGTITDTLSTPIERANLLLYKKDSLVSYTFSNNKGEFSFNNMAYGTYLLEANAMGFTRKSLEISINETSTYQKVYLTLDPKVTILEEVVLKVERDIEIRRDTIIFKADAFKGNRQINLEDLLKNMPGIEVSGNGNVSFQGKPISKIKIDNDDLFGRGYKILTKNLDTELIDKIQVLQNYTDNEVLKNIKDTDEVALNVTLKEDRKAKLFGNIDVGAGIENRHDISSNVIALLKKSKFYQFNDFNNIGDEIAGMVEEITKPDSDDMTKHIGTSVATRKYIDIFTRRPLFDNRIANLNNAELSTLNWITNLSNNTKFKTTTVFAADEKDFLQNDLINFLTEEPFSLNENYNIRQKAILGLGKLDLTYLKKESKFELSSYYRFGELDTHSNLFLNNQLIEEQLIDNLQNVSVHSTFTNKLKDSIAFVSTGKFEYETRPQDYFLTPNLYSNLWENTLENADISSTLENNIYYVGWQNSLIVNGKKSNAEISIGIDHLKERLTSGIFLFNQSERVEAGDIFNNNFTLKTTDIYLRSRFRFQFHKGELISHLGIINKKVTSSPSNQSIGNFLLINPEITLKHNPSEKQTVTASLGINQQTVPFFQLYPNFNFSNYRSLSKGNPNNRKLHNYNFNAAYQLGSFTDKFTLNFSGGLQYLGSFITTDLTIAPENNFISFTEANDGKNVNFSILTNYFLLPIKSNFKLNINYAFTNYNDILNTTEREVSNSQYSIKTEVRSDFKGWFNYNLGTQFTTNRFTINNFQNKNTNIMSFLDLELNVSTRLNFFIKNEFYKFGNLNSQNKYLFSNIEAEFTLVSKELLLRVRGNNLFNVKTFNILTLNSFTEFTSNTALINRYVLMNILYRF